MSIAGTRRWDGAGPTDEARVGDTKKARRAEALRANFGGGRSPRALSHPHTLGALAFAGRVFPDATLRGMRMFRSHGGTVLTVAGRDLSSEASSPGSDVSCRKHRAGRGADTPAIFQFRVGTAITRTAPAFGRALAPCYGSDLLTLRLRSFLQWGDAVFHAAPVEEVGRTLPGSLSPRRRISVARLALSSRAFWRGGPAGKRDGVLVCAVATITLWVTASAHGSKRPVGLTRLSVVSDHA